MEKQEIESRSVYQIKKGQTTDAKEFRRGKEGEKRKNVEQSREKAQEETTSRPKSGVCQDLSRRGRDHRCRWARRQLEKSRLEVVNDLVIFYYCSRPGFFLDSPRLLVTKVRPRCVAIFAPVRRYLLAVIRSTGKFAGSQASKEGNSHLCCLAAACNACGDYVALQ